MANLRRILLGRRLANEEGDEARISNPIALAVFSSDALSSVAYATGEIMAALAPYMALAAFGPAVIGQSWPVAVGIVLLLVILTVSYRQTIFAYPSGGGAYIVARENLGELPAQVAGASLLVDYVLTVAVSVSAGVTAITSAFPAMDAHRVALGVAVIGFVALMNLRGVKESGAVFAFPTYGFVICMFGIIGLGFWRYFTGNMQAAEHHEIAPPPFPGWIGVWVFMKAYAAGCTALTGVEATSNGVSAFREPTSRNAAKTMTLMVLMLGSMFLGITWLANHLGVTYTGGAESLLSMLTRRILGSGPGLPHVTYLVVQAFTMLILLLAANTSYAGFPSLAAIMARDGFLPRQFGSQGDRLVFSNGIFILSILSALLVWIFNAKEHHLLPLYALGVFMGFTISQTGMVQHWRKKRGKRWQLKAAVNGTGAVTALIVMMVIVVTKFSHGAWVVVLVLPLLVFSFYNIHRHYIRVKSILAGSRADFISPRKNRVVVLVSGIHSGVVQALNYAKVIADHGEVEALTVDFPDEHGRDSAALERLRSDWPRYCEGIPLRSLRSPYRKIVEPIVEELDRMRRVEPEYTITIILPEFVTGHWWANILHNQTAWRIKTTLLMKPKTVVISIPYHLEPIIE
ncbi:MAG: APC family permease [Geothrix sp.]|uniref:APC family permease n=1 Tax=Candidatus Geothrix odensensis TaxID=2954440 RepID=A0A936K6D9_9BACT|nr:APC family permease [Candidatus Geothrix odensensis]MBK8789472.1 APC family permease [Holophagaceae bacterium]MBP7617140.1 APC family permease [Geothrix sp.]MCC6512488.1 APC family permease [Geothrix sp.]